MQAPAINQQRLVNNYLKLTQISGKTGNERAIADEIMDQLEIMGLHAEEDDSAAEVGGNAGNLIVNIPGNVPNGKPLLFASHMDTVPLAVGCKPIVDGDVIKTDGSTALGADCRAGCAELLEATQEILEQNLPHGPIQLLFSVGEEGGLLGAYALDPKKVNSEFCYAVDGFFANEIYMQGRHLLGTGERPTAEEVHKGHEMMADAPFITPPITLDLTPEEEKILDFTSKAMEDMGWTPKFKRIEWAASDANALREAGLNAITLGAGENKQHSKGEFVRISDMVRSTQLVRQLVQQASEQA